MPDATHQSHYLSVLAQTPPARLKTFAEEILAELDEANAAIEVRTNRTGLVMLPYTDSVQGTAFHLGEVLMSEAHVRVQEQEGYGACLGRDLEQALAIALLDAVMQRSPSQPAPREFASLQSAITDFIMDQAQVQADADTDLLRKVEATRVEMEVF
ncbi:MAG: phosphonate C-P lyase system protein PhnG [Caldilineaceae bacterium]|nr:phosphonate C-P lyase system protein PhnG [Caldilineaceae bacterium]